MTAARTRALLVTLAWAVGALVVWPMWYSLSQTAPRPLVDWLQQPGPPPVIGGGASTWTVQGLLGILVLSVSGFVFGLVGVWVMRRLGAPRLIWIVAAVASIQVAWSYAIFWSNCGDPGIVHIAMSYGVPALSLAVGAWLGSIGRGVYLTGASSRRPGALL